jgi:hypothetical protein
MQAPEQEEMELQLLSAVAGKDLPLEHLPLGQPDHEQHCMHEYH